jgi:hypothetical protein
MPKKISIDSVTDTEIIIEMDGDSIWKAWFNVDGDYLVEMPDEVFKRLQERMYEALRDTEPYFDEDAADDRRRGICH